MQHNEFVVENENISPDFELTASTIPEEALEKMKIIEALVFVAPEPLSVGEIVEITGFEPGAVRQLLEYIKQRYASSNSGFVLREVAGGFGFYAVPEAAPFIANMIRSQFNPRLTKAALETLSIVAYLQPVSRGVVSEIRGVQSESVMRTLEERGFIEVVGRGNPPGYPALYGTTKKFLERFGLKTLDDLPSLEDFAPDDETIERIRASLSCEIAGVGSVGCKEIGESSKDNSKSRDSFEEESRGANCSGQGNGKWQEGSFRGPCQP